jgi:hypothetical protein
MKSKLTLSLLFIFVSAISFSQGIRGTVMDSNGEPLSRVSIYMPADRVGTTTNLEGKYEIQLEPGEYTLVFQSLGFSRKEFKLTIRKTWIELDVELLSQAIQLAEVVVNPSGEDPAYGIMRKAIGMAPYYLRQTKRYTAEVYLKGSFRMDKIPRLLRNSLSVSSNGTAVEVQEGQTYTMESMNVINYIAPDTFNHTVISFRSSFPAGDESTALGFINSSFYEPDNDMVISPLAPQAMRHYKFRYEGYFDDGDFEVNKIRVMPKRKSQQLVSGYIYIVENLWNIYSIDVNTEMFFGEIQVKQVFQPVNPKAWLPVTHQFDIDFSMMGVKAAVNYAGTVKYTSVEMDEDLPIPELLNTPEKDSVLVNNDNTPSEVSENQQTIDELLNRDDLNNREMLKLARLMDKETTNNEKPESLELKRTYHFKVKKDSVTRDSLYWVRMRPVPLTRQEQASFELSDSLARVAENKTDTVAPKKAGLFRKSYSFFLWGRRSFYGDSTLWVSYNGLAGLGNIDFNPVDGWNYKQSVNIVWHQDSVHQLFFQPEVVYSFSREAVMWNISLSQSYAPLRRGEFEVKAGDFTTDFKPEPYAVQRLADMTSSLLFKNNFKRYYRREFVKVANAIDISNGLQWKTSVGYNWTTPMLNHSNYSFLRKEDDFHANIPNNSALDAGALAGQNSFIWRTEFSYTPYHFYSIKKGRKIMASSRYPTFYAAVEQGVKTLNSDADFLFIEGGVRKVKEAQLFPALSWGADAGWFARNKNMHFSQYRHLNASSIPVRLSSAAVFRLLDDYRTSTNQWFVKGHLKYTSPYLLLKNIPVLSNRMWQESVHIDYLHVPQLRNYMQMGYSMDQIFFMGSIGVFAGFEDGNYKHWGISATLDF